MIKEVAQEQEEIGCKYIHGDVFRFPKCKSLLVLALGPGTQPFTLHVPDEEAAEGQEEPGWKYIHGDVFRLPKCKSLLVEIIFVKGITNDESIGTHEESNQQFSTNEAITET